MPTRRRHSLVELITTGRLGPLHTGMSMGYLASVLGPPKAWIVNPDKPDAPPDFWMYSNLEFSFQPDAHGTLACNWFQFDGVMCTKSSATKETDSFSVWLGKLGAKSKPSDYLRALGQREDVTVQLVDEAGQAGVVIRVAKTVKIIFEEDDTDHDTFRRHDFARRIAIVESNGYCHCITSSTPDEKREAHELKRYGTELVTPEEYLRLAAQAKV